MTLDEALDVLSRLGPTDGDWKAFRQAQSAARALVATSPGGALVPRLERLLSGLRSTHDVYDQAALAAGLARATLQLGQPERFAASAAEPSFRRPWLEGLLALAKDGVDVWPLVEALAREPAIPPNDLAMHLEDILTLAPGQLQSRFTQLLALAPPVALKLAAEMTSWKNKPLGPLVEPVLRLAEDPLSPHRDVAVEVLQRDPGTLERAQLDRVMALVGPDTSAFRLRVLDVVVRQLVRSERRAECDRWLDDPRAAVRRTAFHTLVAHRRLPSSEFSRLITGLRDVDGELAARADQAMRDHLTERGAPPSNDELTALLEHASDARFMALLTWLCTQHPALRAQVLDRVPAGPLRDALAATATRACASCTGLGREKSWPRADFQPPEFARLEQVVVLESSESDTSTLLRCGECQAHYVFHGHVEYDVNSVHEGYSVRRLTLAQLRASHAPHVDFTHPRLASWNEALLADTRHVDPRLRAEAEWELAQRN